MATTVVKLSFHSSALSKTIKLKTTISFPFCESQNKFPPVGNTQNLYSERWEIITVSDGHVGVLCRNWLIKSWPKWRSLILPVAHISSGDYLFTGMIHLEGPNICSTTASRLLSNTESFSRIERLLACIEKLVKWIVYSCSAPTLISLLISKLKCQIKTI